jgi:acyl carrier protein
MERHEVKEEIFRLAAEVFLLDRKNIDEDLKAGSVAGWDSLGHLKLFLAVEYRFRIKFSMEEILNTASLGAIIDKVQGGLR